MGVFCVAGVPVVYITLVQLEPDTDIMSKSRAPTEQLAYVSNDALESLLVQVIRLTKLHCI